MNVLDLFDEITEKEDRYDLFNLNIKGIYFWKLLRVRLLFELTEKKGLHGDSHPGNQTKKNYILLRILSILYQRLFNSPSKGINAQERPVLIFATKRKTPVEGQMVDIYTMGLEEELQEKDTPYLVFEPMDNSRFYSERSAKVKYITCFNTSSYFAKFKKGSITDQFALPDFDNLSEIPVEKIKSLSRRFIYRKVITFKQYHRYYSRLFRRLKPRDIFLVCSYGHEPLIQAARDQGIKVTELQHGTTSSFHAGYSFPGRDSIPYFPDALRMWGPYWYESTSIPLTVDQVRYVGFPYLKQQLERYRILERNPSRVLFLSQGTIGKELSVLASEYAGSHPQKEIVYRLHPSETDVWSILYGELKSAVDKKLITIERLTDKPLYESFACSGLVVGVYSTALYEALAAGCKLCLADIPGVENLSWLIEKGNVPLASKADDIDSVSSGDQKIPDSSYFFKE